MRHVVSPFALAVIGEVMGIPAADRPRVRDWAQYVSYVAANWDERVYPDPGRIDFEREGPPHVAFGYGPHSCVGPLLARREAEVLLSGLTGRFPALRLAVPPADVRWQTGVLIRGPVGLPVTWSSG
ncbi:hypothetical protein ACSNOH_26595 [Streptomyces sp. URMC 127]|uniref:hypothetical protein n=1 Tax=Streptomyces sp. URMC 127 TaxID=3423402 RepID=UPI003F1AC7FC